MTWENITDMYTVRSTYFTWYLFFKLFNRVKNMAEILNARNIMLLYGRLKSSAICIVDYKRLTRKCDYAAIIYVKLDYRKVSTK